MLWLFIRNITNPWRGNPGKQPWFIENALCHAVSHGPKSSKCQTSCEWLYDEIAVMRFPSRVVSDKHVKTLKVDVEYVTPGIVYMVPWQTNDTVVQDASRPCKLWSKPSQKMIQFALFWRVKQFCCNPFGVHIGSTWNGGTFDKLQAFDPDPILPGRDLRFFFLGFHDWKFKAFRHMGWWRNATIKSCWPDLFWAPCVAIVNLRKTSLKKNPTWTFFFRISWYLSS